MFDDSKKHVITIDLEGSMCYYKGVQVRCLNR